MATRSPISRSSALTFLSLSLSLPRPARTALHRACLDWSQARPILFHSPPQHRLFSTKILKPNPPITHTSPSPASQKDFHPSSTSPPESSDPITRDLLLCLNPRYLNPAIPIRNTLKFWYPDACIVRTPRSNGLLTYADTTANKSPKVRYWADETFEDYGALAEVVESPRHHFDKQAWTPDLARLLYQWRNHKWLVYTIRYPVPAGGGVGGGWVDDLYVVAECARDGVRKAGKKERWVEGTVKEEILKLVCAAIKYEREKKT